MLGHRVVDTDIGGWIVEEQNSNGAEPVWDLDRIRALLGTHLAGWLFVAGCVANQSLMYDRFDRIVLLSAPPRRRAGASAEPRQSVRIHRRGSGQNRCRPDRVRASATRRRRPRDRHHGAAGDRGRGGRAGRGRRALSGVIRLDPAQSTRSSPPSVYPAAPARKDAVGDSVPACSSVGKATSVAGVAGTADRRAAGRRARYGEPSGICHRRVGLGVPRCRIRGMGSPPTVQQIWPRCTTKPLLRCDPDSAVRNAVRDFSVRPGGSRRG